MPILRRLLPFLSLLALLHCGAPEPGDRPSSAARPAEQGAFPTADAFRLADYQGRVVLLNFWATWCPPCKAEIPDLVRLRQDFPKERFALIGIALDQAPADELQAHMRRFVEQYRINYPVLLDPEFALVRSYGAFRSIPTTLLIDQAGRTVRTYVGAQPYEVFARDLRSLLGPS